MGFHHGPMGPSSLQKEPMPATLLTCSLGTFPWSFKFCGAPSPTASKYPNSGAATLDSHRSNGHDGVAHHHAARSRPDGQYLLAGGAVLVYNVFTALQTFQPARWPLMCFNPMNLGAVNSCMFWPNHWAASSEALVWNHHWHRGHSRCLPHPNPHSRHHHDGAAFHAGAPR